LHVRSTSGFAVHEPPVMASDVCSLMRVYFVNDSRSVSNVYTWCLTMCVEWHGTSLRSGRCTFLNKNHPFNELDRKGSRSDVVAYDFIFNFVVSRTRGTLFLVDVTENR
jgi:hypothetical protein